ncbi:MAG: 3-phosphoserine/phosphohydroxythreonine transaminase [Pseudomonadota bacterium]
MTKGFNFSAGPAALPDWVKKKAHASFLDWESMGHAVFELSHRSPAFEAMLQKAEQNLRQLMYIPDNYKVLFLQGGATQQFSLIPMNLSQPGEQVAYIDTGIWSKKAITEAKRTQNVEVISPLSESLPCDIHLPKHIELKKPCDYLHYTTNETISGVEFKYVPQTDVPLIADMSSNILSRPVDVSKFGVIYAGAQKNIGPPGLVIVIIREDLLECDSAEKSPIFSYSAHAAANSLLNTPPSFSCYMAALAFEWLIQQGGVSAIAETNAHKAALLYQTIDDSSCFDNLVSPNCRSSMNVTFLLRDKQWEKPFLEGAEKQGLIGLKGHRSVGGMRASIYNAMPLEGVKALTNYMKAFESTIA